MSRCCGAKRVGAGVGGQRYGAALPTNGGDGRAMVEISAGVFLMGSEDSMSYPSDGEAPVHEVELSPFRIDVCAVTNADFAAFAAESGYETDAERFGWSFVFAGLLPDDFATTRAAADAPWWRQVMGADWRHPEGPASEIEGRENHPVVHVSWSDAAAYAAWAGKRLPSEAEWERAARGGLEGKRFPWGDELTPGGEQRMNVWQGEFPVRNSEEDGWYGTCPVDAFRPNDFGLYNMTGNVWEWCFDWFDVFAHQTNERRDPAGPAEGELKLLKGGSFLCHESYCARYRPAARMGLPPDSSASNMGFRCAA